MRVVNLSVDTQALQPVVTLRKNELELLTSVASKNPRTRWLHVSTRRRIVYVSDGFRIISVEDRRPDPAEFVGASYLVPLGPVKEMVRMMKAAHHMAILRSMEDRSLVLALVESPATHQFGDGMKIDALGKVTYARPEVDLSTGTLGITIEGMEARIAEALEDGADPSARNFFLTTEFMKVVGILPKIVKSHTSELYVGVSASDPLVFRTTGAEGARWTYYVMPQDHKPHLVIRG